MKRVLNQANMVATLMLLALVMVAQPIRAQHEFGAKRKSYGYGVDRNAVYYEGRMMAGADARTFEYLGHGYARDRNVVYYRGEVIRGANPRTFRVVGDVEEQPQSCSPTNAHPTTTGEGVPTGSVSPKSCCLVTVWVSAIRRPISTCITSVRRLAHRLAVSKC